jgi:hypothetical protein
MVRAHNCVVMGDLVPGWPWSNLPHAARLYCRKSHPPVGETFRTKSALGVELLRQVDTDSEGWHNSVNVNVGTSPMVAFSGLKDARMYDFAVTAFDASGKESAFSNEVSYDLAAGRYR